MKQYDPKKIEKKWQQYWAENHTFRAEDTADKPKKYILVEFPYPSGEGLHMGHLRPYVAGDVYSRYWRLKGYDVLYPMGWDAFGLPAENYAIKKGVHPRESTAKNVANAKRQIQSWGLGFDWNREVNSTDPEYYKWTQWIFLQLYKAGLAYEATGLINWCPKDKTGLANEEVIDGKCDRCGEVVEKKQLRQWYLKITKYAEKLLQGLNNLPEWPEPVKLQQANWIGKSTGAEIDFKVAGQANNYTILPGWTSGADDNFYPWLQQSLTTDGQTVTTFVYKSSEENSEAEIVEDLLANLKLNENSVLVGHSLGGVMALKWLEKTQTKIAKLVLVGSFMTPEFKDKPRPFAQTLSWKFDIEKIKQNVGEIIILADTTDHIVPLESSLELTEKLDGKLIEFEAVSPHIKGKQEPEVLNAAQTTIKVFTTRPDTIFGATYLVMAPEHPLLGALSAKIENWDEVSAYIEQAKAQQEQQRLADDKDKTGIELKGVTAINPATGKPIPVWTADYVLGNYGTGAIMAVPAHDERDFDFAKKFSLPIVQVVLSGGNVSIDELDKIVKSNNINTLIELEKNRIIDRGPNLDSGYLVNSGQFTGKNSDEVLEEIGRTYGKLAVKYKLRDWVFSRQRYWGEPIPLVHCPSCGIVAVPDNQLPVMLPEVEKYEPTGTGESPLAAIDEWVNTTCPTCSGPAKRETNTMPQWAGSSWYYLRYADPKNTEQFASMDLLNKWLPIDVYFGGMEHTTLHLLYSRFWHLALYDLGVLPKDAPEPYSKRVPHGIILAADGEKMSKSRGNVVNPDDIVNSEGADTLRMYELFLGPHEATVSWNDKGIVGVKRFYDRVWKWMHDIAKSPAATDSPEALRQLHELIRKVGNDIESFRFNTAVSSFMNFHNQIKDEPVSLEFLKTFLILLYPFAPHIAEELHEILGGQQTLQKHSWPEYNEALLQQQNWDIIIQVNGKVRDKISVPADTAQSDIEQQALAMPKITASMDGTKPIKTIYVTGKLINFVL